MEFRVVGWALQRRMRWSWQSINVLIVPVSDSAYSKHCKPCTDLSLSLPRLITVLLLKIIVHMVSPGSRSLQWDPAKTCRPFHDAAKVNNTCKKKKKSWLQFMPFLVICFISFSSAVFIGLVCFTHSGRETDSCHKRVWCAHSSTGLDCSVKEEVFSVTLL